ncbi:hypothetical protein D3C83_141580 [compost metagenome]
MTSSGIHQVLQAHRTSVVPSRNGRRASRNGMPGSVRMSVEPALVAMAAAPITTQKSGVTSAGSTRRKNRR